MKVLLLADARSVHTRRWAEALSGRGVAVSLFSLYPAGDGFYEDKGIRLYVCDMFSYPKRGIRSVFKQLTAHSRALSELKKVLGEEKPDVLHAHYATSFGLLAALSRYRPFILSVWGSDVYEFPYQSRINRLSVKYMLKKADKILSTSHVMARQTANFTGKPIEITPFGVDTGLFKKVSASHSGDSFVVGNVKTLAPVYGIDTLIRAYSLFREQNPQVKSCLRIVGEGPNRAEYEALAESLCLGDQVHFIGRVPNSELPSYYSGFSVAVSLSRRESFGVVAVEAMACECPVIVSDADGFTEVVEDGVTGVTVPKDNPQAAADAMTRLCMQPQLAARMGQEGRKRVLRLYDWEYCVSKVIKIYQDVRESKIQNG